MKIEESNRLIAEFMGIVVYNTYAEMQAVPLDELKPWILPEQCMYHTSWDQLMPVVEKISNIWCTMTNRKKLKECTPTYRAIQNRLLLHEISGVYDLSVAFIEWYKPAGLAQKREG